MNFKFLNVCIIAIIAVASSSCQPTIQYSRTIQNNTDYDIKICFYYFPQSFDTIAYCHNIGKHSETMIDGSKGYGQASEFENCEYSSDSTASVIIGDSSLHLNLDLTDINNWAFTRLSRTFNDGGRCECRLVINNNHIQ